MIQVQGSLRAPTRPRKLALVTVGDYISIYGMRKIAASAERFFPDLRAYFVTTGGRLHSIKNILFSSKKEAAKLTPPDLEAIAAELADYDMVGFSSMTIDAEWTKKIIAELRKAGPEVYVIWGGIHPMVAPEDAIEHADAVCVGEGDLAFDELLERLMAGEDYRDVENFWFREGDEVLRNGFRPLMTPEQMQERLHPLYAQEGMEYIYEKKKGKFVPVTRGDYLDYDGLSYHTLWTQGCPYRCSYCSNTAFLAIDKKYAQIRQPSVDYIIGEVKAAVAKHPYINTVVFDDDCMGALPTPVLREFSEKWRERVGIPFFVSGIIPSYVEREKLEILLAGGMNRLRMGLQSGSDRLLKFFKRPNKPGLIPNMARTIADYRGFMIAPAFDLIVDIPVEQEDDVKTTIRMIHDLARPFTLNVFSLRVIPGTTLADQIQEAMDAGDIDIEGIDQNYHTVAPTAANVLLFLVATTRLPKRLFEYLLGFAKPAHEEQRQFPVLLFLVRMLFFVKRGLYDLRFMDFSVLPGKVGWLLWKIGFVGFWQKYLVRHFDPKRHSKRLREDEVVMPVPKVFSSGD